MNVWCKRGVYLMLAVFVLAILLIVLPTHIDRERACPRTTKRRLVTQQYHPGISLYNLLIDAVEPASSRVPILSDPTEIQTRFRHADIFRDNYSNIRDEALHVLNNGSAKPIWNDTFFTNIADKHWKRYYIKWYGPVHKQAKEDCPLTCRLIEDTPQIYTAMFSILDPGAVITPHRGPFRGCYRYHLGLLTPNDDNCYIRVHDDMYSWRDGEDVLFDDTYLHNVRNNTNKIRIVLFMDVQRKLPRGVVRKLNEYMCKHVAPWASNWNAKREAKAKAKSKVK